MKQKNILITIACILITLAIPVLMDICILGNGFPSNIDNATWASFLGSYIGGIATLLAVFITILDNNKKIKEQKEEYDREQKESRKMSIKPYLDTRFNFMSKEEVSEINDIVFDIVDEEVKYTRFKLNDSDRKMIEAYIMSTQYAYIKYSMRNIGAGSAVDLTLRVNDREHKMAIAKDENINLYFLIKFHEKKEIAINIGMDFWDVETLGHYYQDEKLITKIQEEQVIVKPIVKNNAYEI